MTMGQIIGNNRKKLGLTQEALASKLEVTNQAVSKWESDQCCPDVALLPALADIFGITIDALFGREPAEAPATVIPFSLPWEDDGALHAVLFVGRELVEEHPAAKEIRFTYDGDALNVVSAFSVSCGDVGGSVNARGDVDCGNVGGPVTARGDVDCSNVNGSVTANGDVNCADISGPVQAGGDVSCDEVNGSVTAGGDVDCGDVSGDVNTTGDVTCGDVEGNISTHGDVTAGDVAGAIHAGGDVEIG